MPSKITITPITGVRVKNLNHLLEENNLTRKQLAAKTKSHISVYNTLLAPKSRSNFSDDLASKIENVLKLSKGWLDQDHQEEEGNRGDPDFGIQPAPPVDWVSGCVSGISFTKISPGKAVLLLEMILSTDMKS